MLSTCIVSFTFGLILAIDYLYDQKSNNGKWKINFNKLVLFIIPSLVLSLVKGIWFFKPFTFGTSEFLFYFMVSTLLGYMLATSFYKGNEI